MTDSGLCARFDSIMQQVRNAEQQAGRTPGSVRLVAVSKNHPADAVACLTRHWSAAGAPLFGESYVQEALAKQESVANQLHHSGGATTAPPEWHFIGHIQSRKAKELAGRFALIHSVDSLKVARNLHKEWENHILGNPGTLDAAEPSPQRILIQVNIGREPQKSGVLPEDLEKLCIGVLAFSGLRLEGLMCLPPVVENAETARPFFAALNRLRDAMRQKTGLPLPQLSMGMSDDFTAAIAEGATLVRIGSSIFGSRAR